MHEMLLEIIFIHRWFSICLQKYHLAFQYILYVLCQSHRNLSTTFEQIQNLNLVFLFEKNILS
jgi:hypothetical protein